MVGLELRNVVVVGRCLCKIAEVKIAIPNVWVRDHRCGNPRICHSPKLAFDVKKICRHTSEVLPLRGIQMNMAVDDHDGYSPF
jgi:hypothetical protein